MTEAEWLECVEPIEMVNFVGHKASDRKFRLFAVACCESSRQLLLNKDHRQNLEIASRFADGMATERELAEAYKRANDFACGFYYSSDTEREVRRWAEATAVADANAVIRPLYYMESSAADAAWMIHRAGHRNPNKRLAALAKDIFGNPFRPVIVDLPGVSRDQSAAGKLAQSIYEVRTFDRLPVLADTLEAAGCDNAALLGHLRGPGPHVRGCWALDLILGKE
jgi:hypothetical protein